MQPPTLRVVSKSAQADVIFPLRQLCGQRQVGTGRPGPLIKEEDGIGDLAGPVGTTVLVPTRFGPRGSGDIKCRDHTKGLATATTTDNILLDVAYQCANGSITEEDYNLTPMNNPGKDPPQLTGCSWDQVPGTVCSASYWGKTEGGVRSTWPPCRRRD